MDESGRKLVRACDELSRACEKVIRAVLSLSNNRENRDAKVVLEVMDALVNVGESILTEVKGHDPVSDFGAC